MHSGNNKLEGLGIGLSGWGITILAPILFLLMYVVPYLIGVAVIVGWIYLIGCWVKDLLVGGSSDVRN